MSDRIETREDQRQAFRQLAAAVAPVVAAYRRAFANIVRALGFGDDPHHPPPLCIDGHAYRRRTRVRRKR